MNTNRIFATALTAVVCLTAACDDGSVDPETGLTIEDLSLVAMDGDALAGGIVFSQLFGAAEAGPAGVAAAAEEREFERSRPCSAGGTIELSGTINRTQNGEGTVEATIEGTRTQNECARTREDVTMVVDGSGSFSAYRKRVNGEPVGNQTSSYEGSFDWTRTRGDEVRTGTCTYRLESVRNPDSGKVRVSGMICDREIDRERDWNHGT